MQGIFYDMDIIHSEHDRGMRVVERQRIQHNTADTRRLPVTTEAERVVLLPGRHAGGVVVAVALANTTVL